MNPHREMIIFALNPCKHKTSKKLTHVDKHSREIMPPHLQNLNIPLNFTKF